MMNGVMGRAGNGRQRWAIPGCRLWIRVQRVLVPRSVWVPDHVRVCVDGVREVVVIAYA